MAFVPVDFGRNSLRDELGRARFDRAAPAFVSWLGVTMYLERGAIEQTLALTGGFGRGSEPRTKPSRGPGRAEDQAEPRTRPSRGPGRAEDQAEPASKPVRRGAARC